MHLSYGQWMDVRHMRQIVAIASNGSFVKAARELSISQPTLSRSIARLEDELGMKLFDRSEAGAAPTPMGLLLAERAQQIIADATRLKRDLELSNSGQMGHLRLGFGPALGPVFAPRLAVGLAARFPKIEASFFIEQRRLLLSGLMDGRWDLLFVAAGPDLSHPERTTLEVSTHALAAVAAPSHPLAGKARVCPEDLAEVVGVTTTFDRAFTSEAILGLRRGGSQLGKYVTNEFSIIRALVIEGGAVAIGFAHLFRTDLLAGRVVRLNVSVPPVLAVAVFRRASSHSSLLREVISIARTVGGELETETPRPSPGAPQRG